ncbi:hypothetical protein D3C80_2015370 [compost metagenome]
MAVKKTFNFKLGDKVKLESGETGTITGRAHFTDSNPQYYLRYVAGDGRQVQCWWDESAVSAL